MWGQDRWGDDGFLDFIGLYRNPTGGYILSNKHQEWICQERQLRRRESICNAAGNIQFYLDFNIQT